MLVVITAAALAVVLSVASARYTHFTCGEPPDVEFAFVSNATDEDFALGTIITYGCEIGYSFSGESRTISCAEDDSGRGVKWSETKFHCAPQSCGDPGYVNNARRLGYRFTFPNFVKYECDDGYKMKGVHTRYCQASGSWSGRLPTCSIVFCNQPEEIANGRVTYKSLKYGSQLNYTCNEGFKIHRNGTVYCTADGEWSKNKVECVESKCDLPVKPDHGTVSVSDQSPRLGTLAFYQCDDDRIAYGSMTNKCLGDGQWLFDAPECLLPCTVPNIRNGKLGRMSYRGYYFSQKKTGSKIEDDEELVLRCSEGYEVGGTTDTERKISCSRGIWSLEPHCEPAFCRSSPPLFKNAKIEEANTKHGGKIIYRCVEGFKNIQDEDVVCNFGNWRRPTRSNICQSTRCSEVKLHFAGLQKEGYIASYEDGHILQIACKAGYEINHEAELRCSEGDWKTNVPPCEPADCTEPPEVPHTKVERASTSHDSYATYTCQEPYKMIGEAQVQCSYGKWTEPPRCNDGRCDINDLMLRYYISREETPRFVNSGQDLHVTCNAGYTPRLAKPRCLNGTWIRYLMSPCREDDCLVPKVEHGYIVDKVAGDWSWDFWEARYVQEFNDKTVIPGTLSSPATNYYLHCDSGYSFLGSRGTVRKITCNKANWEPKPVCYLRGSPPTTKSSLLDNKTTSVTPQTTLVSVTTQSLKPSDSDLTQLEVVTTALPTTVDPVQCSCEYPVNDENLVATVDGKKLRFHDEVKDGSVVVFRCLHVGYHRFRGPREIKCEKCRTWHSTEFPTCSNPSREVTVIVFQRDINISADGSLEIKKGQTLTLSCLAYAGGTFPNWTVPTSNGVAFSWETKTRKDPEDVLYMSLLKIENADLENGGAYNCSIDNQAVTSSTVTVTIIDPNVKCPEFQEDEEIDVFYNNERRVDSTATFSCRYQARELEGRAVAVCLNNGNWSDPPPQCLKRKCEILKETELLKIDYSRDREIGSYASFHCVIEAKRTGVAFAKCMENGSWSDPTPSCDYPPCSLEDLYSSIPQEAEPESHNFEYSTLPYNAEIALTCKGDLIVLGNPVAKCEKNSTWKVHSSFRCSSGCPAVKQSPDSKLIVAPEKDLYVFGETVQFSCPFGMNLTTDLKQMMCLKYGWSEESFPDCAEKKNPPET